jgi:AcrR family transcriptional regulator
MKAKSDAGARWRRRKDSRPEEITLAALDCFAERGFAACRLDDIAARAGITKGTLYLYFDSKEELFKAVVRQALLPRIEEFERLVAGAGGTSAGQLEAFIMSWPSIIATRRISAIPRLIIAEAGNFPDLARYYFDEIIARARRLVVGMLRRGIERGEFRAVDPDLTFFSLIAPLLVAVLWKSIFEPVVGGALDVQALCRSHLSIILRGLAPEGGAA